ncbi:hypothetical protein B0S90_2556 [Caldicellulosiruptor bescii]|uniref:Uncharacterized protein n=2 Tax=Caldicellulosiruptor bescii TaxID=31899 RepID=B9MMJ8_CALBD|nr:MULTISPECIES: hypothetical protein [Clostridia]ACM61297.1 hypothetical protein Athe_2224 [Caldicellulosiruptor bescii DSM 6725]PBC88890.1 hypothetical protein B0S87_1935 [Caldicellulosiruptor bescii]PBC91628.1 hypothetical protein B0S89_2057 [Caldicellulosiruptor bescii]PBD02959.1 hypothetical protein B0S85_0514 [Caldicellulosiruptor bescii]PBD07425.1 hypothetical protein B0S90_2556 [Caldicellulosiruptor bescii]
MVTFTKSKEYDGTPIEGFIYVNGMENIGANLLDSAAYGRAFTIIPLIVGKIYECEFYEWNYSGQAVHIGVGIKNESTTTPASITILKKDVRTGSGCGPIMTTAFMQSNFNIPLNIPPRITSNPTQGFTDLLSTLVSSTTLVNGRVRFKVNSGEKLFLKVYVVKDQPNWEKYAGWTNLISAEDLKKIDPATGQPYDKSLSQTGLYQHIRRHVDLPVGNNTVRFAMGKIENNQVVDRYNIGEFESPIYPLPFSNNGNLGNYGIVYTFYYPEANAKYVTVTPQQVDIPQKYTLKINGIWQTVTASKSNPFSFELIGGNSFWFVLPGGSYGDVEISFKTTL